MEILKKIKSVNLYKDDEMKRLVGGMASNQNSASDCSCSDSTNGWWTCNDNDNQATGCSCSGNNDNTNKVAHCSCS